MNVFLQMKFVNKKIRTMEEETVYINVLTDFGFKRVFGNEEDKEVLTAFLNACLADFTSPITELTFLPTEQLGIRQSEKRVVFDLYCKSQSGEHFIIELQRTSQHFYADRSISYVSRVVSRELRRGDRQYRIPKVYSINILDFEADEFKGRSGYFWPVQLKDSENKIFSEKFTLIYIELNKFAARNKKPEFSDELQKWLYVMKNVSSMGEPEVSLQEGAFRKFFESCKYSKLDVMEKEDYRKSVLDYEDVQDAVSYAQERGMAEGVEMGRMEGLREGRREGRQEERMEMARKMLECKFEILTIAKLTGLSEEEILAL